MPQPPVDAQTVTDTGLYIFEAIATLEFTGRRPSRSAIAAAARVDDAVLDAALGEMVAHGLLAVTQEHDETGYEPVRRDWSTQPGEPAGHPMG
ncbi:MAG TPA: hypothetical protein VEJ42_01285 [Streptosporangiaceae bacterium]|nr:hypothetical protein [Streptosporangiaceae bacterium]